MKQCFMLCLLVVPLVAWSHSKLVSTEPEDGAVLDELPSAIVLRFNRPIEPRFNRAELWQDAAWIAMPSEVQPKMLVIKPHGANAMHEYRIRWSVMSRDGHRQQGVLRFFIK